MRQDLIEAITDMREEDVLKLTQTMLDAGNSPIEVLDACRETMEIIGKRFEVGESFIPELIMAQGCYFENTTDEKLRAFMDLVKK